LNVSKKILKIKSRAHANKEKLQEKIKIKPVEKPRKMKKIDSIVKVRKQKF